MELVLNTYGVALSRDNEGFVIVHNDEKQRIPTVGITSSELNELMTQLINSFVYTIT
jgi:hypothetical protein